jgi:hypothetical protein
MFKKILAALAVTAGLLLAAPAAANATNYTDGAQCSFDVSVVSTGGTASLICIPGTWTPGESITWSVSGPSGTTLASFDGTANSSTFSKHANADGSDVLTVALPQGASGTYSITGIGQTSGHECTASLTVLPADQASTVLDPGSTDGLAHTGSVVSAGVAWMGGSLVVLGLIALAVVGWLRKAKTTS